MQKNTLCLLVAGILTANVQSAIYVDFEELSLNPTSVEEGANFIPPGSFTSRGVSFNNSHPGYFEGGFAYSNEIDVSTPGFGNDTSAYTGGGAAADGSVAPGTNYGVAYYAAPYTGFDGFTPTISLPLGESPVSIRVTNTTYTALTMQNGGGPATKFGGASGNAPDYFKLSISGYDNSNLITGIVDFYLADYRFADNSNDYIVSNWALVDLTALGTSTRSLKLNFESSDVGSFGINTPTYVAIDNLQSVPEPTTALLACLGGALLGFRRRR